MGDDYSWRNFGLASHSRKDVFPDIDSIGADGGRTFDGCSDFKFLTRIVIPLSKPIIAVLVLMYAIGYWNSYFEALIFLKTANLYPLQLILRNILILNSIDPTMIKDVRELAERQGLKELLKYSLIVVASARFSFFILLCKSIL